MRERPILFSGPMVRAILEGRKTQTRRTLKAQPRDDTTGFLTGLEQDHLRHWPTSGGDYTGGGIACPYGQPGDRLWVRETWGPRADGFVYRATEECSDPMAVPNDGRWRPSIHMPRWACRLVLEITDVRVERLQAISEADAAAEGAERDTEPCDHFRRSCAEVGCLGPTHRAGFADLWASINGQASWDANPWVWVVEFRRVDG